MTLDEFDAALEALGWKVSEFCRATGLHRNTPSRWRNEWRYPVGCRSTWGCCWTCTDCRPPTRRHPAHGLGTGICRTYSACRPRIWCRLLGMIDNNHVLVTLKPMLKGGR